MAAPPPCQSFEGNCTEWINSLPVGFTFQPTDTDLAGHYLNNKNRYGVVPTHGLINEINLNEYSEPSQLPNLPSNIDRGKKYFFTSLKTKNGSGRIDRMSDAGKWKWKMTRNCSYVNGQDGKPIGKKTPLAYYVLRNSKWEKTEWLMQQYTLLHEDPKFALCVVYLTPKGRNEKEKGDDKDSQSSMPRTEVDSSDKFAPASCWMPVSNLVQTPVTHPLQSLPPMAIPSNPQFNSNSNPATLTVNTPFTTHSFPTKTESSEVAGFSYQKIVAGLGSKSVSAPSHKPTISEQTMPSNGNAVWGLEGASLFNPQYSPNHGNSNLNQEGIYPDQGTNFSFGNSEYGNAVNKFLHDPVDQLNPLQEICPTAFKPWIQSTNSWGCSSSHSKFHSLATNSNVLIPRHYPLERNCHGSNIGDQCYNGNPTGNIYTSAPSFNPQPQSFEGPETDQLHPPYNPNHGNSNLNHDQSTDFGFGNSEDGNAVNNFLRDPVFSLSQENFFNVHNSTQTYPLVPTLEGGDALNTPVDVPEAYHLYSSNYGNSNLYHENNFSTDYIIRDFDGMNYTGGPPSPNDFYIDDLF